VDDDGGGTDVAVAKLVWTRAGSRVVRIDRSISWPDVVKDD